MRVCLWWPESKHFHVQGKSSCCGVNLSKFERPHLSPRHEVRWRLRYEKNWKDMKTPQTTPKRPERNKRTHPADERQWLKVRSCGTKVTKMDFYKALEPFCVLSWMNPMWSHPEDLVQNISTLVTLWRWMHAPAQAWWHSLSDQPVTKNPSFDPERKLFIFEWPDLARRLGGGDTFGTSLGGFSFWFFFDHRIDNALARRASSHHIESYIDSSW